MFSDIDNNVRAVYLFCTEQEELLCKRTIARPQNILECSSASMRIVGAHEGRARSLTFVVDQNIPGKIARNHCVFYNPL